jgi:multicomponent Na+:H+ antiporter subunit E
VQRFLLFLLIGVVIFEARPASAAPLAAGVVIAWILSIRLPGPPFPALRAIPALAFMPFFIAQSVRGGFDVALRAFGFRTSAPEFLEYRTRIRSPTARVAFVNAISLLPGTFTAALQDDRLTIHVLDAEESLSARLRPLEDRIASIFGETLEP